MLKENRKFEILTPSGFSEFSGIQELQKCGRIRIKTTLDLNWTDCSLDHKFLSKSGWIEAKELVIGVSIDSRSGFVEIIDIEIDKETEFLFYDALDTAENKYYTNNLVSHNCDFLGSSDTLISGIKLRQLTFTPPVARDPWNLDIHHQPEKDHNYIICADTSHGVGLDYSAFTVIDVTTVPYVLAAKFYDNNTSPMVFPEVIARAGVMYNNAYVLCEINDVGQMVVESLYRDLEYENVISTVTKGRAGQKVSGGFGGSGVTKSTFGLKMTPQVKRIGCSNLKDLIECDKLLTQDFDLLEELARFVKTKQSYEAEPGYHDDLVMSLVLFGWLVRQPYFRDLTNTDVRNQMALDKYKEVWDDLLPAGFLDDGSDSINLENGSFTDSFDNMKL